MSQGAAEASSANARAWRLNKGKSAAPKPAPEPGPSKAEARPQAGPGGLWLPSQLRRPPCAFLAGATVKTAALAPTEKLPPRELPTLSPAELLPPRALPAAAVWGAVAQAVPVLPVGADIVHRPIVGGLATATAVGGLTKIGRSGTPGTVFHPKTVPGARISRPYNPTLRDSRASLDTECIPAEKRPARPAAAGDGHVAAPAHEDELRPAEGHPAATAPALLTMPRPQLPSGRPSPAHHIGYLRAALLLAGVASAVDAGWQEAKVLVDSGSQQQDLVSNSFAERLGLQGRLSGAAAQADGSLIPLYDVGGVELAVNGVPTLRRFQRANIAPYDVILGERWCEAEGAVLDYAHAALWQMCPGRGLLPLVLNARPGVAARAAEDFLAANGVGPGQPRHVPTAQPLSMLGTDMRYRQAVWVQEQADSSARLRDLLRSGTRAGETEDLTQLVVSALPQTGAWGREPSLQRGAAPGARAARQQRRHTALCPVVDYNKELPEDEELDEREVPGLESAPSCSFDFVEADVRAHLAHLPSTEVDAVVERLKHYECDVFETRSLPKAPPFRSIDLDITIRPGCEPPKRRAYPVAPHHLAELDRQIQLLLDAGMIRNSMSEYAAPVLFAPKKDGKLRLCIDYRLLNQQTVRDRFPTPTASDLISSTAGGRLFSKIDLLAGFHQLRVREEDIHKTAFVTPRGHYEWTSAPFGLSATPSAFQRLMTMVLQPHIRAGYACVYLDDVCVWTKSDDPLEHLEKVEAVLASLREHGLVAKGAKCEFFRTEMEFLGFMIGRDGVRPVPGKVEAIQEVRAPETVSQLRSFLGMVGFFRSHIDSFAEVSSPLTDLLRGVQHGRQRLDWTLACEQSFSGLKDLLTSAPVLRHFDPSLRTAVHVDGSQNAVGAVLLQWEDGEASPRPVCFLSRKLSGAQFKYDARNVEALAAQIALSVWRPLLYGVRFELVSDHASLGTLLSQKALTPRLLRLCEFLAGFDFDEVKYCRGVDHVVPDFLSRPWLTGSDAEPASPLHLLSHPRGGQTEVRTTPRDVCLLLHAPGRMVVGARGVVSVLPRVRLEGREPVAAVDRLVEGLTGGGLQRPVLVGVVGTTELWRLDLPDACTLAASWQWAPLSMGQRRGAWCRRDFAVLSAFGLVQERESVHLLSIAVAAPDSPILARIAAEQQSDVFLGPILEHVRLSDTGWWRDFSVQETTGLLLYERPGDVTPRVCVPASCRAAVLDAAHGGSKLVGHPGVARTATAVARYFYWPRLYADVAHFVRSCRTCAANKPSSRMRLGAETFETVPLQPFSHWAMDLIGPLPKSRSGNDWIVTWVDRTSKTIVARACKTGASSGADLAALTFEAICCQYGLPARLTHDNDVRFKKFWKELWRLVGTSLSPTSAWNPQADPAERANRQVQEALRAAVSTVGAFDEWDKALPYITFGLNTQWSSATGTSAFELTHGFAPRTPLTVGLPTAGKAGVAPHQRALQVRARFQAAADAVAAAQARIGRILAERRTPAAVSVGDWMWLDGAHVAAQLPQKLAARWYGPYEVVELLSAGAAVRLDLPAELGRISRVVNLRRLKFFEARDEALCTPADAAVEPLLGPDGTARYEVERIVMHRCHRGVEELFVHWRGFDASRGCWVRRDSLVQDVPALVAAYDASPSVLVARRSAPARAAGGVAVPLRRSARGRAPAVHALWRRSQGPSLLVRLA